MDAVNDFNWTNTSSVLPDSMNGVYGVGANHTANTSVFRSQFAFLVCVLGVPGNTLVIAVYVGQTTSSTRLYMFALAIVDAATCVCGIVLTSAPVDFTTTHVAISIVHTSAIFSTILLAFVSFERLRAVRCPHKFNIGVKRAKLALAAIAVTSAASATMLAVARFRKSVLLSRAVRLTVTLSSVLVMILCYIWMAAILLRNARRSRNRVDDFSGTDSVYPGHSSTSRSVPVISSIGAKANTVSLSRSAVNALTIRNSHVTSDAKTYKNVSLLFIVTVVFIACWLPRWLSFFGLSFAVGVQQMFLLTFGINPFIYSVASDMFRADVRLFCRRMRSRLTVCYR